MSCPMTIAALDFPQVDMGDPNPSVLGYAAVDSQSSRYARKQRQAAAAASGTADEQPHGHVQAGGSAGAGAGATSARPPPPDPEDAYQQKFEALRQADMHRWVGAAARHHCSAHAPLRSPVGLHVWFEMLSASCSLEACPARQPVQKCAGKGFGSVGLRPGNLMCCGHPPVHAG